MSQTQDSYRVSVSSLPGARESRRAIQSLAAPLWLGAIGVIMLAVMLGLMWLRFEVQASEAKQELERSQQQMEQALRGLRS